MSEQSLSPEPVRAPGSARLLLVGVLAFLAGIAVFAVAAHYLGWGAPRAPEPVKPAAPPSASAPAPALPAGTDTASLYAREQALAARLDGLEGRAAQLDTRARDSSLYATRAEALLLAAAARRQLNRGMTLGYLEGELRQRFADRQPQALAAVVEAGRQRVTLEDLRSALEQIAPKLAAGSPDDGWLRLLRRQVADLIVIRQDSSPSPRPADRLARARAALSSGQVELALAEVRRMPGAEAAASWSLAAERYIAAQRGLATLEQDALAIPAGPPVAPVPAPVPTPAPTA